jgi:hypothetical protein
MANKVVCTPNDQAKLRRVFCAVGCMPLLGLYIAKLFAIIHIANAIQNKEIHKDVMQTLDTNQRTPNGLSFELSGGALFAPSA